MALAQNGPFVRYSLTQPDKNDEKKINIQNVNNLQESKSQFLMTQTTFDVDTAVQDLKKKQNHIEDLKQIQFSISKIKDGQIDQVEIDDLTSVVSKAVSNQMKLQEYLANIFEEREQTKGELANIRGVLANKPSAWREREKKYQYDEDRWNTDKLRFQKKIQSYKDQLNQAQSSSKAQYYQLQLEEAHQELKVKNQQLDKQEQQNKSQQEDLKKSRDQNTRYSYQIEEFKNSLSENRKLQEQNQDKLQQIGTMEHEAKTLKFKVQELYEQNKHQNEKYNLLKQDLQKSRSEIQKQETTPVPLTVHQIPATAKQKSIGYLNGISTKDGSHTQPTFNNNVLDTFNYFNSHVTNSSSNNNNNNSLSGPISTQGSQEMDVRNHTKVPTNGSKSASVSRKNSGMNLQQMIPITDKSNAATASLDISHQSLQEYYTQKQKHQHETPLKQKAVQNDLLVMQDEQDSLDISEEIKQSPLNDSQNVYDNLQFDNNQSTSNKSLEYNIQQGDKIQQIDTQQNQHSTEQNKDDKENISVQTNNDNFLNSRPESNKLGQQQQDRQQNNNSEYSKQLFTDTQIQASTAFQSPQQAQDNPTRKLNYSDKQTLVQDDTAMQLSQQDSLQKTPQQSQQVMQNLEGTDSKLMELDDKDSIVINHDNKDDQSDVIQPSVDQNSGSAVDTLCKEPSVSSSGLLKQDQSQSSIQAQQSGKTAKGLSSLWSSYRRGSVAGQSQNNTPQFQSLVQDKVQTPSQAQSLQQTQDKNQNKDLAVGLQEQEHKDFTNNQQAYSSIQHSNIFVQQPQMQKADCYTQTDLMFDLQAEKPFSVSQPHSLSGQESNLALGRLNSLFRQTTATSKQFSDNLDDAMDLLEPQRDLMRKEQGTQVEITNDLWDDVTKELDLEKSLDYVKDITQFRQFYKKLCKVFGQTEPQAFLESYKEQLKRQRVRDTELYFIIKTKFFVNKSDGYIEVDFLPNCHTDEEPIQLKDHNKTDTPSSTDANHNAYYNISNISTSNQSNSRGHTTSQQEIGNQRQPFEDSPSSIAEIQAIEDLKNQVQHSKNGIYHPRDDLASLEQQRQIVSIKDDAQQSIRYHDAQIVDLYRYQAENFKRRLERLRGEKETLELAFNISKQQLEGMKLTSGQTSSQKFLSFFKGSNNTSAATQSQVIIKKLNNKIVQLQQEQEILRSQLGNSTRQVKLLSMSVSSKQLNEI